MRKSSLRKDKLPSPLGSNPYRLEVKFAFGDSSQRPTPLQPQKKGKHQPMINDPSIQTFDSHPYTTDEPVKTSGTTSSINNRRNSGLSSRNDINFQNLYRVILPKVNTEKNQKQTAIPYEEVSRNKSQALFQRTVDKFTNQNLSEWANTQQKLCLLYTSPSPRDRQKSRMPSSA